MVRLGDHEYTVVAQRIGRIQHELAGALTDLGATGVDAVADLMSGRNDVVEGGWRMLQVFVPDLMPEHEFAGFASVEDFRDANYVAAADRSPTADEIWTAGEAILSVNRLDEVKRLGKLVPPDLIRGLLQKAIGDSISSGLQTSPATSGDSVSTTSSVSPPTSGSSEV